MKIVRFLLDYIEYIIGIIQVLVGNALFTITSLEMIMLTNEFLIILIPTPRDGMQTLFLRTSEFALEIMRKHIHKLEEENLGLKNELQSLR